MLALAFLAAAPVPLNLDTVTVDRARLLDGRIVVASFVVAKPAFTFRGRTVLGAADRDDGAERVALLPGRRFDVREGGHLAAVGVLRVIDHKLGTVAGVLVAGWTEIRVDAGP